MLLGSSSALQKAHKGDSTILNVTDEFFLLLKMIRSKILYWNSPSLVPNVVSIAKEYKLFPFNGGVMVFTQNFSFRGAGVASASEFLCGPT